MTAYLWFMCFILTFAVLTPKIGNPSEKVSYWATFALWAWTFFLLVRR